MKAAVFSVGTFYPQQNRLHTENKAGVFSHSRYFDSKFFIACSRYLQFIGNMQSIHTQYIGFLQMYHERVYTGAGLRRDQSHTHEQVCRRQRDIFCKHRANFNVRQNHPEVKTIHTKISAAAAARCRDTICPHAASVSKTTATSG